MSKEEIISACQEIVEEGQNLTVKAVIDKIGGSTRDVAPVVKEFKESLDDQENGITVNEENAVKTTKKNRKTEPVAANLERVDRDAQLTAAREIIATAYYKKTKLFTLPGLQEEVNQALSELDEFADSQDETLSPKGMLNWLTKR